MNILVTGSAGFIGSKLAYTLAKRGDIVVGLDNINDYYDVRLKYGRLSECGIESLEWEYPWNSLINSKLFSNYKFIRIGLENKVEMKQLFDNERFDIVVNMAAQAGVRYSITNPYSYVDSNLLGFINVLECCRYYNVKHLIYASSSSVYGLNTKVPFNENDNVDTPVSLYAATKKSNELMAHAYSKLYGISTIGLRYFTVYGPWGRPDMAPMLFAEAIQQGKPIKVFNNGKLIRDFTYIDDIVNGTICAIDHIKSLQKNENQVPYRVYNIGCSQPVQLMDFIYQMEISMGKTAKKIFLPMQQGDVYQTYADTNKLENEIGYKPTVNLQKGVDKFVDWYVSEKNVLNHKYSNKQ
ncbi:MAG: NAD-dependent epimerase/dehydratase family protein [Bacteroidales bacterium]|nr:NAD-dependent epimerase/dehydratase family protein [Bacteroidales bacterium]